MKSKFEDLQCPCGCELGVPARLELLYKALIEHGFTVTSMVDCSSDCNHKLRATHTEITDAQHKRVQHLVRRLGFECTAYWCLAERYWVFDITKKQGVFFA